MKNFPVTDKATGREYWISRSIAAVIALYAKDSYNEEYVFQP